MCALIFATFALHLSVEAMMPVLFKSVFREQILFTRFPAVVLDVLVLVLVLVATLQLVCVRPVTTPELNANDVALPLIIL